MKQVLLSVFLAIAAVGAGAQSYPNKPIRLVVPFAPGGGADIVARAIAGPLGKRLGQTVIVDNKPGGGATLGADIVAKAPADGYTLLYATPGPQITNPFLMRKLPYDPEKDLTPISGVAIVPSVLVVHKDLPVHTVKELIAYARANPGKLNFASAGLGATSHLAGELLKQSAKIDIVHIPYKGTGAALTDLLSGQVQMSIDSIAVYRSHIESGSLRAIGVSSFDRSRLLPNVPPIADDIKGFEGSPVNYIAVRSGTPPEVINRLNADINAVINSAEIRELFDTYGVLAKSNTPAQMSALIRSEAQKWKTVIEVSGARID